MQKKESTAITKLVHQNEELSHSLSNFIDSFYGHDQQSKKHHDVIHLASSQPQIPTTKLSSLKSYGPKFMRIHSVVLPKFNQRKPNLITPYPRSNRL